MGVSTDECSGAVSKSEDGKVMPDPRVRVACLSTCFPSQLPVYGPQPPQLLNQETNLGPMNVIVPNAGQYTVVCQCRANIQTIGLIRLDCEEEGSSNAHYNTYSYSVDVREAINRTTPILYYIFTDFWGIFYLFRMKRID